MKLINLTPAIIAGALVITVAGSHTMAMANARRADAVATYQICNDSRMKINGMAEDECAAFQEANKTEFLCERNDMTVSNHCWVELK